MFRIGVSFSLILLLFHKRPGEKRFSVVSDERLSSLAILRRHTQAQNIDIGGIVISKNVPRKTQDMTFHDPPSLTRLPRSNFSSFFLPFPPL